MEMRILSELGRKALFDTSLKETWGSRVCREVFEACGSPREWADYVRSRQEDPTLARVREHYEAIATEVLRLRVLRPRKPVILPDF